MDLRIHNLKTDLLPFSARNLHLFLKSLPGGLRANGAFGRW